MDTQTSSQNTKELTKSLFLIALIGGIFVIGVSYAIKLLILSPVEPEVREVVEKIIEEKEVILRAPKCERNFAEYEKLTREGQGLLLLTNTASYAVAGDLLSTRKTIRRDGEIACGYIYVRASTGGKSLNELYDSIYVSPQELGGHLIRPRSIAIEKNQGGKTEVLFPLSVIPYLPSIPYNPQAQNFEIADWVKLFNAAQKIKIDIGLSTLNTLGLIEEVRIAYRCWNPETGKETNDCQLSVDE